MLVEFPWKAVAAWDKGIPIKRAKVHRLCAASLLRVFAAIWRAAGEDQETIESWGMHLYGGGFEFRPMRGSKRPSSHSWGCAVDFDPVRNRMGSRAPNFASCPRVLDAFNAEGWTWGGDWSNPDGMHWQAASL